MKKVLVVEDEFEIAEAVRSILEDEGYAVDICSDGMNALEYFAGSEAPALVLTDVMMPRLSGYELVERMHEEKRLEKIPVVVMSAVDPALTKQRVRWNQFLRKPFTVDELIDSVRRLVGEPGS